MPALNGKILLAALALVLLCGCGWQLRGASLQGQGVTAVAIQAEDRHRQLALLLERALTPLVAVNAAANSHTIVVEQFTAASRLATVSATIRSAEEQLNMALTFSFKRGDDYLIRSQTVRLERLYRNVETDILASKNERRQVEREMRQALVEQLVRQIAAHRSGG